MTSPWRWRAALLLLLAVPVSAELPAQPQQRRQVLPGDRPVAREKLEQRLRQGLWRATKQRVGLTDAQMSRLAQSSTRYEGRRRMLVQEERRQRRFLRTQLMASAVADQDRVGSTLDRLLAVQRERLDLQAEEQRELASFMTPVQRARYMALREQVRRRMETLRGRRTALTQDIDGEVPLGQQP